MNYVPEVSFKASYNCVPISITLLLVQTHVCMKFDVITFSKFEDPG